MAVSLTREEFDRLRVQLRSSERQREKQVGVMHSSYCCNRDPHDVYLVLLAMRLQRFKRFHYRSINRILGGFGGNGDRVKRNAGVSVLLALEADGFMRVHDRNHCNLYERLFPLDEWEDVYECVCGVKE